MAAYIMDAKMSDIPVNGQLDKLLIFRNYPLELKNRILTKKEGTLGAILVIGNYDANYGNFTDFDSVSGLESIAPATKAVTHKMINVELRGLGSNTNDVDINALTLVNLSNASTFKSIRVFESLDDGIEIFGGNVHMKKIRVRNAADDYFDTDHKHSGTINGLQLYQTSKTLGKSLIECGDSKGSTRTKFVNVTFNDGTDLSTYQNNGDDKHLNIKKGSKVTINGVILTKPQDELP
jgi:hypothetical protein